MSDPRPRPIERRPAHVPDDWLTRQQAQQQLGFSPYLLGKYMRKYAETHPGHIVDLGPGRAAYLSPALVEEIAKEYRTIDSVKDVSGYYGIEASAEIVGCSFLLFSELIQKNQPDPKQGEVRTLKNRNSQTFPHYSDKYLARLRAENCPEYRIEKDVIALIDCSEKGLEELIGVIPPEGRDIQILVSQDKKGLGTYYREAYVSKLKVEYDSVPRAEQHPEYLNRTQAQDVIGCDSKQFFDLVNDNRPDVAAQDMRMLRNVNKQPFPYYSATYVERLRLAYVILFGDKPEKDSGSRAYHGRVAGEIIHRPGDILARRQEIESRTINLTESERAKALARVDEAIAGLDRIFSANRNDPRFTQTRNELHIAARDLRGQGPIPRGLDNLIEKARRFYLPSQDDE